MSALQPHLELGNVVALFLKGKRVAEALTTADVPDNTVVRKHPRTTAIDAFLTDVGIISSCFMSSDYALRRAITYTTMPSQHWVAIERYGAPRRRWRLG
jgi:hypothetical protein